eukprot:8452238-Pyramimonas_sp.AAC.1
MPFCKGVKENVSCRSRALRVVRRCCTHTLFPARGDNDIVNKITSFYGSSCANNNGKGALNTPENLPLFSPCVRFPTFSRARR